MSLPSFPCIDPPLTKCGSLNMILASVAMEELGLSHIINAEGEKLQYVLGTLEKSPDFNVSINEILAVNKSVKCLIESVTQSQMLLKNKMESALEAMEKSDCESGRPGPSGKCCVISFPGCPGQCWSSGKPLHWTGSKCSDCCSMRLSPDCSRIVLNHDKCFVVSFSIDLCVNERDCKCVSVSVQTNNNGKKTDNFTCHAPIIHIREPITVTASGIFVSTSGCGNPVELTVTLLTPCSVRVNKSSICIMEV